MAWAAGRQCAPCFLRASSSISAISSTSREGSARRCCYAATVPRLSAPSGRGSRRKIPQPRLTPVEQAALTFERYLLADRRLAEVTVEYYVPFVREFLADRFGDGA